MQGKVISRVRLEGQHAARNAALLGFAAKEGEHRLVSPMDTVKIANGKGAGRSQARVLVAAEKLHELVFLLLAAAPRWLGAWPWCH